VRDKRDWRDSGGSPVVPIVYVYASTELIRPSLLSMAVRSCRSVCSPWVASVVPCTI